MYKLQFVSVLTAVIPYHNLIKDININNIKERNRIYYDYALFVKLFYTIFLAVFTIFSAQRPNCCSKAFAGPL